MYGLVFVLSKNLYVDQYSKFKVKVELIFESDVNNEFLKKESDQCFWGIWYSFWLVFYFSRMKKGRKCDR